MTKTRLPKVRGVTGQVANEAVPAVRFYREGVGSYQSRRGRFHVFDEARWDSTQQRSPRRFTLTDRAVVTTGCPNDDTDVVARTPTLEAARQRANEILIEDFARGLNPNRVVIEREKTPRELYWKHLGTLQEAGIIDYAEFLKRLDAWDAKHCSAPPRTDLRPMSASEHARVMSALVTDEERRELQLADIAQQGAKAAAAGRAVDTCPYATGAAERAWKMGYWRWRATARS